LRLMLRQTRHVNAYYLGAHKVVEWRERLHASASYPIVR
jgi:hypothetical protein